jgi:hypothetical protein
LTGGSDVIIENEDFSSASQIGGTVKDLNGNEMETDSSIDDPDGSFGGESDSDNGDAPYITSIEISNGGNRDTIDIDDEIKITFSEAIDPESINNDLEEGEEVEDVPSYQVGGVSVSSSGLLTIKDIAKFDVGEVDRSGSYAVTLGLSSSGKVLTITLTDGSDSEITDQNFDSADQIGGTIEDLDGNEMETDSNIGDPDGSF